MPGHIQPLERGFIQFLHAETRQYALEVAPVQHIELAEWQAPSSDLFHCRLVFVAPGVGKREPVERTPQGFEYRLGIAGDAVTPVDQRTKNVEEQRSNRLRH